jgi:hypothetical protein
MQEEKIVKTRGVDGMKMLAARCLMCGKSYQFG